MDLYIHSPTRLHGVVFNWLSTGTSLPLTFEILTVVSMKVSVSWDVPLYSHINISGKPAATIFRAEEV
jgi:hypothetical protein